MGQLLFAKGDICKKIKHLITQCMHIPSQRAHFRNAIVFSDRPRGFIIIIFPSFPQITALLFKWKYFNRGEEPPSPNYLKCCFTKNCLADCFTKSWLISCLRRFLGHLETSGTFVKYLPVLNGTFLMNPGSSHSTMTFGKDQLRVKKQNKEIHKGKKWFSLTKG